MEKPIVFISSTYSDLKIHRNQILYTLEKFDITVLGMEKFGARKEDSLTTCLKEVEKCNIFILIVGMRFGSIDRKSQKSYTWLEYEKANELRKDILVYLIDETNGDIKVSDFEIDNYKKLQDFKEILKENHTIDFYINVSDLTQKIFDVLERKTKDYQKKLVRPEKLECRNFRFDGIENNKFIIFVGYLNNKPYEFFTGVRNDEEGILIPSSVTNGFLIESWEEEGKPRIDFQYINSRGYKTTIEGIDIFTKNRFKFSNLDNVVSSLLQDNVEREAIFNAIKRFNEHDFEIKAWKKTAIEILTNIKSS